MFIWHAWRSSMGSRRRIPTALRESKIARIRRYLYYNAHGLDQTGWLTSNQTTGDTALCGRRSRRLGKARTPWRSICRKIIGRSELMATMRQMNTQKLFSRNQTFESGYCRMNRSVICDRHNGFGVFGVEWRQNPRCRLLEKDHKYVEGCDQVWWLRWLGVGGSRLIRAFSSAWTDIVWSRWLAHRSRCASDDTRLVATKQTFHGCMSLCIRSFRFFVLQIHEG